MIFDLEHETLIGTIAHIRAKSEQGPRFDKDQSEDENRSFSNLMAMCANHSKIIDGTKSGDFSVETLKKWKIEHEQRVSNSGDRSWIKPANSITEITSESEHLNFSYWVDRTGRPRLFSNQQIAVLNVLMSINMMLHKVGGLPERMKDANLSDIDTVLQQEWAKFEVEKSVIADLFMLFAMAGNVTFAEFLGFVVEDNDPTLLVQDGARRINKMAEGNTDTIVKNWFKSDISISGQGNSSH